MDFCVSCVLYLVGFGSCGLVGLISKTEISDRNNSDRYNGFVRVILLDAEI